MTADVDFSRMPDKGGVESLPDPDTLGAAAPQPRPGQYPSGAAAYEPLPGDSAATSSRRATSTLADLRDELSQDAIEKAEPIRLEVPSRPGYEVEYLPQISATEVENWRKAAKSASHTGGVDEFKVYRLMLAAKAERIFRNGEPLLASNGVDVVNFRLREFHQLLEVGNSGDAVRMFYGLTKDNLIESTAERVMAASGWGEGLGTDPTAPPR